MANFPPRAPSGSPTPQPPTGQPAAQPPVSGAGGAITGMHTAGVRPCPACSTLVNVHATVCPNCGEALASKEKVIRCRRCRHRASSNLVVCPHCGRDLQPATSRWLTWGAPLLLVFLLGGGLLLTASRGGNPGSWAQAQVDRVVRFVQSLGARLQPDVTVSMIPAGQDPNDPLVSQAALSAVPAAGQAEEIAAAVAGDNDPAGTETASGTAPDTPPEVAPPAEQPTVDTVELPVEPTVAPTVSPTALPTALPTEPPTATVPPPTPTASPTAPATATAAPTATSVTAALTRTIGTTGTSLAAVNAVTTSVSLTRSLALAAARTPTATQAVTASVSLLGLATPTPLPPAPTPQPPTPTLAATPTPAVLAVHAVRRGDTLFEIAQEYDVTVEDILVANGLTEDDVYTIQPGDELNIPAPTPEGGPPAGATATPAPVAETYTVRAGDTMLAIANRYDVTVEDLLAANDMTINDARSLQPGDVLTIPGPEGVVAATPTAAVTVAVTPTATATDAPTATPAPTVASAPGVRVDAPRLRAPENGSALSCAGQNSLVWLQVPSVRATDLYLVHLGYVNSVAANGAEEVIWVISQQRPVSTTSWALDSDLCGLAPTTAGRQWRWYVEVVEPTADGLQPVSPASGVWGFAWQ